MKSPSSNSKLRKENPVKGFQILRLGMLCPRPAELGIKRPPPLAGSRKDLLGLVHSFLHSQL